MTKESGITFRGRTLEVDEAVTPSLEKQGVVNWLEVLGGIKLVEYIRED